MEACSPLPAPHHALSLTMGIQTASCDKVSANRSSFEGLVRCPDDSHEIEVAADAGVASRIGPEVTELDPAYSAQHPEPLQASA